MANKRFRRRLRLRPPNRASESSVAIASSTTVAVAAHPIDDDVDFATGYFSLLVVSIP